MTTRTVRRSLTVMAAVALLLAGCAGSDDGVSVTGTADEATAVDEPAPASEDAGVDDDGAADDHEEAADDAMSEHDDATEHDDAAEHDDESVDHDESGEEHGTGDDHDEGAEDAATGDVDHVVEIDMEDIAFSVDALEFAVGDRVRFEFVNVGEAPHEALIGDLHLQQEHEAEMAAGAGHGDMGHHGELSTISLEPGESGSLVHEFTEAGELWMGCHVPGHWPAGMQTRITVTG